MSKQELNSTEEFYEAIREGVSLVDFNAPWCAPCRAQDPIIERLCARFEGRARIASLNIDRCWELGERIGIHGIPTLVLYRDNREVMRFVGLQEESCLVQSLEQALAS